MNIDQITGEVVDSAIKVHSVLGPGLLESAYTACLAHELRKRGLEVRVQFELPIEYEGLTIDIGYRVDLLVQSQVIVELKAVARLNAVHQAQLLSYLRLSGRQVGLLVNFHEYRLVDGIKRMVNNYRPRVRPK